MIVQWGDLKPLIDSGTLEYRHVDLGDKYYIAAFDKYFKLNCTVYKNTSDGDDYEANYLSGGAAQVDYSKGQPVIADKGTDNFDTVVSHDLTDTTTWPATNNSLWIIEPSDATKKVIVLRSEVQFSHDVQLETMTTPGEIFFDIWAYNPLYDSQQATDPDDPTFVPGVSTGNPLRFLYKRTPFTSIKDVFDYGNDHYSMNATVDGISGVTTVRFNYDQAIVLDGSAGSQIRFSTKNDLPLSGTYCTVSFVIREVSL